jgi:hypothetical protein
VKKRAMPCQIKSVGAFHADSPLTRDFTSKPGFGYANQTQRAALCTSVTLGIHVISIDWENGFELFAADQRRNATAGHEEQFQRNER